MDGVNGEDVKRILVFEDEIDLANTFIEVLKSAGYVVEHALDGFAGLDKLAANKDYFHLCLLDLMMPGMDGLEVVRTIKEKPEKYGAPKIIVLTSLTSDNIIKDAFLKGADSYLIKSDLEPEDILFETNKVLTN